MSETVPVEIWPAASWSAAPLRCKAGLHSYGPVTDADVTSASMVCQRCHRVWRFDGALLIECIRRRSRLTMRCNEGDKLHRRYFGRPAEGSPEAATTPR